MTREERFEIYEEMLSCAVKDLKTCIDKCYPLYGFCQIIFQLTAGENTVNDFPELMKYRPIGHVGLYWFNPDPYDPDATKRIDILKEILSTK